MVPILQKFRNQRKFQLLSFFKFQFCWNEREEGFQFLIHITKSTINLHLFLRSKHRSQR